MLRRLAPFLLLAVVAARAPGPFGEQAKTDPTLLEGSGLDAEDIGVFHKNSLEKCSGVRYAYHNLGNMVLLPRVDVVLMKAAGLG